jgi:transcriptional regulator with XRE-family HTH domain
VSVRARPKTREQPREPELVLLDGLAVRRRRHAHGWSPRDLVQAIESASVHSSGLRRSLSPNQIEAIEERAERIPYALVLLLADGLDCDPIDLIAEGELSSRPTRHRLH